MPPRTPLLWPREYFEDRMDPLSSGAAVFALHVVVDLLAVVVVAHPLSDGSRTHRAGSEAR